MLAKLALWLLPLLLASQAVFIVGSSDYGYYTYKNYLPSRKQQLLWKHQQAKDSLAEAALRQLAGVANARLVAMQGLPELLDANAYDGASTCANSTAALLRGITTGEPWALTFLDADAKPPAAMSYGGLAWLGNYDLCMSAAGPAGARDLQGGYCLTPVTIAGRDQEAGGLASPLLRLGLCWPRVCTSEQAENITARLLASVGSNSTWLTVVPDATECKLPRRDLPWTVQAIAMLTVLSLFGSVILVGTLYDLALVYRRRKTQDAASEDTLLINQADAPSAVRQQPQAAGISCLRSPGLAGKMLLCFSAYTNAGKIFDVSPAGGTLTCVHGLRFLSMLWVMLGHTYYFAFPVLNNMGQLYTGWETDWTFQVVANATVAVDSFFVLSGLLSTVLFFRDLRRLGNRLSRVNWFMFYLHRYWRLTPPYLLVMASYVCLFQYVYEGPLYPQNAAGIDPSCPQYWWANALYVNNVAIPDDKQCMAWSWYLANDMQFYAVSPLFLIPLARWPRIGICALLAALLASVTGMGVYSSSNGMRVGFNGIMQEFSSAHIRPWFRAPPYLIGMLAGYALHRLLPTQLSRRPMARPICIAAWLTAAGVAFSVVYGLYGADGGREPLSQGAASLYNALYRPAWGLAVAWVTLACVTGNASWVNRLLSAPAMVPLSRLTYCAYLVHPLVMMAYYLSRRQAMVWDNFSVVYAFLPNVAASYALALVASLVFEAPLIGLEKLLREH